MTGPLSPRSPASYNHTQNVPASFEDRLKTPTPALSAFDDLAVSEDPPSSPFQTDVDQENRPRPETDSPWKPQPSHKQGSPIKGFSIHEDEIEDFGALFSSTSPLPLPRTTLSPVKEATSTIDLGDATPTKAGLCYESREPTLQVISHNALREGRGDYEDAPTILSDDTCFSTFSAIPNADMTMFASLGNNQTPRVTPGAAFRQSHRDESSSPNCSALRPRENDTTNLLLDFTQQYDAFAKTAQPSPRRRGAASPSKTLTESNLSAYINNQRMPFPGKAQPITPGGSKQSLMNLLDFDLPPQLTPRSVPTITIRELETVKSSYLSEISALKASLSGREAEVESFRKAVSDAERRVGEALEIVREERNAREHAEQERSVWERKGKEIEGVLKSVKEEVENAEEEREELLQKLDENVRLREEAEFQLTQAASRPALPLEKLSNDDEALVKQRVAQQLDEKMENLARELHAVYKKKHESKVATLKKTYEVRSEKKCFELQQKVDQLTKQNSELSNNSISSPSPSVGEASSSDSFTKSEIEHQNELISDLSTQLDNLSRSNLHLERELEKERSEKGELVAAVDEMLMLQLEPHSQTSHAAPPATPKVIEEFKKRMSGARPSGLRAHGGFGGMESSIGRSGVGMGMVMGMGGAGKSRMMSNIERMGHRGGD